MKLLVDIGNTRLKWALLSDGKLGQQHALAYRPELLCAQLDQAWSSFPPPKELYLVSVASRQIVQGVSEWVENTWNCPVEVLHSEKLCAGVANGYTSPERLGVDRWAAMVAAYGLVGSAVCVIDCGTALTCDAIDSHGNHLGGVIVPGQEMMRRGLLESTAGISLSEASQAAPVWGTDTTSCVWAGGLQASVALIERAVTQLQQQLKESVKAVITGGDAETLMPWLSLPYRYEADLVLQGVARIVMEQRG